MLENREGSVCELARSLSFLACSFLICGQARLCSDTPHHSSQVTVGLLHFQVGEEDLNILHCGRTSVLTFCRQSSREFGMISRLC